MSASAAQRKAPVALIVDDDPAIVAFLRERCVKMGLEVREASNGLQALVAARRDPPDVLIVDVNMPQLDGLSVCSKLLDPSGKNIDVIVISGYSDEETAERCGSFGAAYAAKGPQMWNAVRSALTNIFPGMAVQIEEPAKSKQAGTRERPLILVIDDDEDVGNFITSRLRKCGVDAILAGDGRQGYRAAVRERPTLIISDCVMPGGDIHFLIWRLRSTPATENIPVFGMTGYDLDAAAKQSLLDGVFGHRGVDRILRKPLRIEELLSEMARYCAFKLPSVTAGSAAPHAHT